MTADSEYFIKRSTPDETGCWNWNLFIKPNGYGQYGRNLYAHRGSWEAFNGPIPDGMDVDHKCMNKACVNPGHLHVVSRKENMRLHWLRVGRRMSCHKGHDLTPDNRVKRSMGRPGFACRKCQQERRMKYYYQRRAIGMSSAEAAGNLARIKNV